MANLLRLTLRHQVIVNALACLRVSHFWNSSSEMLVAEIRDQLAYVHPVPGLPISERIAEAAEALCTAAAKRSTASGAPAWMLANLKVDEVLAEFFIWRAAEAQEALRSQSAEG